MKNERRVPIFVYRGSIKPPSDKQVSKQTTKQIHFKGHKQTTQSLIGMNLCKLKYKLFVQCVQKDK